MLSRQSVQIQMNEVITYNSIQYNNDPAPDNAISTISSNSNERSDNMQFNPIKTNSQHCLTTIT